MNIKNTLTIAFFIIISTLTSQRVSAEVTVQESIIGLYVAYYNRAPDESGLNYWSSYATAHGNTAALQTISQLFRNHQQFAEEYPASLSTTEFVTKIYQNMLNRAPDAAGLNFWVTVLNNGTPKSKFIVTYVNDVLNYTGTDSAGIISNRMFSNKTDVGQYYVDRLGIASNGQPGSLAYTRAIDVLHCVTEDLLTVDAAKALTRQYLTTNEPIENNCGIENKIISGTVRNSDGIGVSDVNIKFEYLVNGEEKSTTSITDILGNYEIKVNKAYFDENSDTTYLIYAYKEGYISSTKTFKIITDKSYIIDFTINPIQINEVVLEIEPKVHHLGDDNYSGSVNSQFQKSTEGLSFNKSFNISSIQYNDYNKAILRFEAKGIQADYADSLLKINNTSYSIPSSPDDGSYKTYTLELAKDIYHEGSNNLEIISGEASDYDDFEFSNIILEFVN